MLPCATFRYIELCKVLCCVLVDFCDLFSAGNVCIDVTSTKHVSLLIAAL